MKCPNSPQVNKRRKETKEPSSTRKKAKEDRKKVKELRNDAERDGGDVSEGEFLVEGAAAPDTEVEFQEDENLIQMRVDGSEFPSKEDTEVDSSKAESSDEGQIIDDQEFGIEDDAFAVAEQPGRSRSTGNNDGDNQSQRSGPADNPGFIYVRNPEFNPKARRREDERREERIVNRTVAKIQEFMARGGYLNRDRGQSKGQINYSQGQCNRGVVQVDSEINFNLNANLRGSAVNSMMRVEGLGTETQQSNKTVSADTCSSEVTLYKNAVQPEKGKEDG